MSEPISRLNATEIEEDAPSQEEDVKVGEDGEDVKTDEDYQLKGFNEEYIKDGKLFGKWENPNDMAQSYKKLQDEKAQDGRKAKDDETQADKERRIKEVEKDIISRLPTTEFKPSQEDYDTWIENGGTKESLELKAIKLQQSNNKISNLAGGVEKVSEIADWAKDNLSSAQLEAFNLEVKNGTVDGVTLTTSGEFAFKGLISMYNEATSSGEQVNTTARLQGKQNITKMQGYSSTKEITEALEYLRKNPRDTQAQKEYEAKMRITKF